MNVHTTDSKQDSPEFTLYTKEGAPEGARDTLNALEEKFGFIPNVLRQLAESPTALGGVAQTLGLLEGSSLSPTEQRMVLLAVSFQHAASYCMAANSTVAHMLAIPAPIIEELRKGEPLSDPKLEALRCLTLEMVRERGWVSEETTRKFFEAGFTKAQVFEVILGIALETMINYTERVASTPMDEQFREYAWSGPDSIAAEAS